MGERGPPRTPTAILAARGSWLAKTRPDLGAEPELSGLDVPAEIAGDPVAAAKWAELVPHLVAARVLASCDRDSLSDYCRIWSLREHAAAFLRANGRAYQVFGGIGKNGEPVCKGVKPYPQVWEEMRYTDLLRGLRARLGIDPASRSNAGQIASGSEPSGYLDASPGSRTA